MWRKEIIFGEYVMLWICFGKCIYGVRGYNCFIVVVV